MIKFLKVVGWTILSFFLLIVLLLTTVFVMGRREINIAESPRRILKISGLSYSDFTIADSSDNMDRASSAWSSYEYTLQVNSPTKLQKKVEKLVVEDSNWSKSESGEYCYTLDGSIMLSIYISPDCSTIKIDYSWEDFFS
ncbi:MAG: hypothetical protein ACI3Z8_00270 [Paludibacteraceae bacterium]